MAKRRLRRRRCPKIRGGKPKYIGKADLLDGLCDFIDPDGAWCNHWRARDSGACPCHRDRYNGTLDPD